MLNVEDKGNDFMKNIFVAAKSVLGLFVVIFSLFLVLGNYKTAVQMDKNREAKNSKQTLKITDQYDASKKISLNTFFSESDSLNRLQNAYSLMLSYFGDRYFEIGEQSIEYIGMCNIDEKFVVGGIEGKNQEIAEIKKIITPLNSIQLGKSTIESINLNKMIQSGKEFVKEDFIFDEKDAVVPLVLGYDYKNQFEIGDTFSFFYLGKQFIGEIKAFLDKDSSIIIDDIETMNLDKMIVMPSFEINTNYNDDNFKKTLALLKTEGYVLYENQREYQNIVDKINIIKENTDIQYSYIENLDFVPLEQCYFMPKYLALFLLVLGEILFLCYIMFIIKVVKHDSSLKIINQLFISSIITFVTYELAYMFITKIQNNALVLNIMRIRYTVIAELLIAFIIVVSYKIHKIFSIGGVASESDRRN
nr:hypothetical protein [uncultured Anaerostipes sp.]